MSSALHPSARVAAFRVLACAGLLLCVSALPLSAQQAGAGTDRLASIEATGSSKFNSDQIVAATGLHVGAQVSRDDLQKVADQLAQLGVFSNVQYRFATTDAGVKAEYHLTDAATVPVFYDNFPWFKDDEITAAIKSSGVLFDGSAPEHGMVLDAISDAIAKLLVSHGVNLSVSHTLTTTALGDSHIQLFHAEDSGITVAGVEFGHGLAQTDHGIQMRLADIIGAPYSRSVFELFEIEQVRPVYLSHAFLNAKLGPSSVRFTAPGSSKVVIIAPIDAGLAYAWNAATWTGNSAVTSAELEKLVTLKTNDPADGIKIEAVWQSVRDLYAQRGYLDATLDAVPHIEEFSRRVSFSASIVEGPQYHMGQLVLSGLSIEGERRIRAAWSIHPGEVFNEGVYNEFLENGVKAAFSGLPFHYDKIGRFLQKDPKAGIVDVMLDFQ